MGAAVLGLLRGAEGPGTREVDFSGSLLVGQCVFVCQNGPFGRTVTTSFLASNGVYAFLGDSAYSSQA